MRLRLARSAAFALAITIIGGGSALAITAKERTTRIASPPPENGSAANAASANPAFSGDGRSVRYLAFDSAATNLVDGDTNGGRDVFLMSRGTREGRLHGEVRRVSLAGRSGQVNGHSSNPSADGDTRHRPGCVAFESTSTDLSGRDRSADSDVYVRNFRRNRTELASPGRRSATNPVIHGECETVTFESRGKVYVRDLVKNRTLTIGRGRNPDQQVNGKGVAYERGRQVYYRAFPRKRRQGNVSRASRTNAARGTGQPWPAPALDPAISNKGNYIAWTSAAAGPAGRSAAPFGNVFIRFMGGQ